jgi:basic membrane protein A
MRGSLVRLIVFGVLSLSGLSACTRAQDREANHHRVGLVLDKGGKDDKSFNSAAYLGATEAVAPAGFQLKIVECPDDTAFEPAMRTFAEREYPLVIAIGFGQMDALKKVAPLYPKTHFAIVDGVVDAPNVASLLFAEHEGSYLVGYLAGLVSKSNIFGFVGGMDVPMIRRFEMGYEAGVKAARPGASVIANYAGVTSAAWANPSRGKELALGQYARGAEVIFSAAGATNAGVFDAAEEKQRYAIGVDSNQNAIKPGRILTSMLKRVDQAVMRIVSDEKAGTFHAGTHVFGLSDKGVDAAIDSNNEKIVAPYRARLEDVKAKIIRGEIKVPDYYKKGGS